MSKANKSKPAKRVRKTSKPKLAAKKSIVVKAVKPAAQSHRLYVLSDSTGNLPRHMVTTFVTQFPDRTFDLVPMSFLQSDKQVNDALTVIKQEPGIVMHAMISPMHKAQIEQFCLAAGLHVCDLTGRFVEFLVAASGVNVKGDRSALHPVNTQYFGRIEAMEFTLTHDDGLGLDSIEQADIVLAGVSRTSKTPTSIYLAQLGYKVANIALAVEVQPPEEIRRIKPGHGVGLMINPSRLVDIRHRRQQSWQMTPDIYSAREHVEKEIAWSRRLFSQLGWPTVDVTNTAIEETAGRILKILSFPTPGGLTVS